MANWIVRVVLVLAPSCILGLWGWSYLLDCVRVLQSPGVPISVRLDTPGGQLEARAQSYVLDVFQGTAVVAGVTLRDPQGALLLRLGSATVNGWDLKRLGDQVIKVRGHQVFGRLERRADGRFAIQEFLNKPTGEPNKIPFDVDLRDVQVRFVDLAGSRRWERDIRSDRVTATGIGDDWMAGAVVRSPGIGSSAVQVQRVADGIQISGETSGLQLEEVWRHVAEVTPSLPVEARRVQVGSLRVTGPVRVFLPSKTAARVEAKIQAEATDVSFERYDADHVRFEGLATVDGLAGQVEVARGRANSTFRGRVRFASQEVGGRVSLDVPNESSLPRWAAALLPKGVSFASGHAEGWASAKKGSLPQVSLDVKAQRLTYRDQEVSGAEASVRTDGKVLDLDLHSGTYSGNSVAGGARLDLQKRTVLAVGRTDGLDLGGLLRSRYGFRGMTAKGNVLAAVTGTWDSPSVNFSVEGPIRMDLPQVGPIRFDEVQLAGEFRSGSLRIDRAIALGPTGSIGATGGLSADGRASVVADVRGVTLATLNHDVSGIANLRVKVTGTLKSPVATGVVEAYETEYLNQTIPVIRSGFVADRRGVALSDVRAYRGASVAKGAARIHFATKALKGTFEAAGIQLADWTKTGAAAAGALSIEGITLSGTLNKPRVEATVVGPRLLVKGVKVADFRAKVIDNGPIIRLFDISGTVATGQASGAVTYDIRTGNAQFRTHVDGLDLGEVIPEFADAATVEGKAVVDVSGRLSANKISTATATSTISGLVLNDTNLGSGKLSATLDGSKARGSLLVGQLDSYLDLSEVEADLDAKTVSAVVDAYRLKVPDLAQLGLRYVPASQYEARQAIAATDGFVNVGGKISGAWADPNVQLDSLNLAGLTYRGRKVGDVTATVGRVDRKWSLGAFKFAGPSGNVTGNGTFVENGELDLSGDLSGIDLEELGRLDPRLASTTGKIDQLSFVAKGPVAKPEIQATLNASGLVARSGEPIDRALRVSLDTIHIEDGLADATGIYFYRGFQGALSTKLPFEYPFTLKEGATMTGRVTVARRSLKEIARLVDFMDESRTEGTLSGELLLGGKVGKPVLTGNVQVAAASLAVPGVTDILRDLRIKGNLANNEVSVLADGTASRGGTLHAEASTKVDPGNLGDVSKLLEGAIRGTVEMTGLRFRQDFKAGAFIDGKVGGKITLDGSLGKPRISGTAQIATLESVLPTFEPKVLESAPPVIDPRFDLKFRLGQAAHVRSSTADLFLDGGGALAGSMREPRLTADLVVSKGSIRLPGSVVRVDQGGRLTLDYDVRPRDTFARFDVDLLGRTRIVSAAAGQNVQRYDVELTVKGDLFKDQGLVFLAQSDPPGLSQDEILGLLGRTDLIATAANDRGAAQNQIRDALTGFALPVVFDPITQGIARSLGLDYLSLEYNTTDQASVSFARTLSREFSIQGSRQLSVPPPGFPQRFDLRLVYRPRRLKGVLSRLSFSLRSDQDRPWRIAVDYGFRF